MSETNTLAPEGTPPPEADVSRETLPEGQEAPKPDTEAEPKPPREPWEVRRIRQLVARSAAQAAEIEALKASAPKPDRDPSSPPTQAELDRYVDERAEAKAKATAFNRECDDVAAAGRKEYPDFGAKLDDLWATLGGKPDWPLVEAAIEVGDAHKLLYRLGQDPEEAERIAGLSPARRGAALARFAAQTAPVRAQSNAPPPITPLRKGGGNPEPRPDGSMGDFERWYEGEMKKRHG